MGLISGLSGELNSNDIKFNETIAWSLSRENLLFNFFIDSFVSLFGGLLFGLVSSLIVGLLFGSNGILVSGLVGGIFGTVSIVFLGGRFGGLLVIIQHIVLRYFLANEGIIPRWRYDHFLDYCAEAGLLRKVGGGYIFRHRILLEHFADQYESTSSSKQA